VGKINVLSFAVANLIAAGEVVDRPASVIKELMENAIDAGATAITVEIRNGGISFMRVSDNGCGISPEDLPVAIRRHATSKIKNAEDLDGILTLGFRGEALAAIAAVSNLRIISRTRDADMGAVLCASAGEQITVTEQGCSVGTSVIVENLFFNVPARRKFLKKDVTESMAVAANVEKIALSNPKIAFRLIVDGNIRIDTAGDGSIRNTVHAVYGKEFASRLLEVEGENEGIEVRGFIGRTDNYKANRNYQNFFVNGRFVKSKTAMAAIEQAYTSYMPPEKFPCCVLFIDVNPSRVDVNVHPAKLEVKFSNEKAIFEAIYYTVRSALESSVSRPSMELNIGKKRGVNPFAGRMSDAQVPIENGRPTGLKERQLSYDLGGETQPQPQQRMSAQEFRQMIATESGQAAARTPASEPVTPSRQTVPPLTERVEQTPSLPPTETRKSVSETPISKTLPSDNKAVPAVATPAEPAQAVAPVNPQAPIEEPKPSDAEPSTPAPIPESAHAMSVSVPEEGKVSYPWKLIGSAFNAYVLVEVEDKLLVIDQHAAHERILFEQLKAGLAEIPVVSQMLMLPAEIMMTGAEVEILKEYNEELTKVGFYLRYARNTVYADAIPDGIEPSAVADMLQTMSGRLLDNTGSIKLTRDIIFEKALYQAACKAAIKAGRVYAAGHIEWLVKRLMELPDITFCPHGRPVAMELSKRTLDRQFDRTGF
jgi:DNA mismatch repair protein MutL